jgi:hypothetical protein
MSAERADMNREIRFRGKRVDNGEWVEGYYFKTPLADEATGSKPEDGWFFLSGRERHCISKNGCAYEVDPSTVGQFTGLKDKNGKEIYEGDIAKDPDGVMYAVRWQRFSAAWEFYNSEASMLFVMRCPDMFEVIGNIYDNPDLLKG